MIFGVRERAGSSADWTPTQKGEGLRAWAYFRKEEFLPLRGRQATRSKGRPYSSLEAVQCACPLARCTPTSALAATFRRGPMLKQMG
eukprot:8041127-Alexandrium_andersonii.AAC.1